MELAYATACKSGSSRLPDRTRIRIRIRVSLFRRRRSEVAPLASVCKFLVPFSVIAKLTVSKTYIGGLNLNCLTPKRMLPSFPSLRRQHPCCLLLSSVARTSSLHHTARPTTQRRPSSTSSTKPDPSRSSWSNPFVALPSWTPADFRLLLPPLSMHFHHL